MSRVLVTGAAGAIGSRVMRLLADASDVASVVALDLAEVTAPGVEAHRLDLASADLSPVVAGVDVIIHLAVSYGPEIDDALAARVNVDGFRRLLEVASKAGVTHVVVVSSATVYGAWANNPIPLTEDAPLRPNPELGYAVQKAEAERLVVEWKSDNPTVTVTVLRPTVAMAEDGETFLAHSLRKAAIIGRREEDPPAQFLHMDDLAAAVELARSKRLNGPFNVAPDGWLAAATVNELAGQIPKPHLPEGVGTRLARVSWRSGVGPLPPGFIPYANHPWVVANDRLKAEGWVATHSNEEAFVAGHEGSWISQLSPKKRQELALGLAALVIGGVVAGVVTIVRRQIKRRAGVPRG